MNNLGLYKIEKEIVHTYLSCASVNNMGGGISSTPNKTKDLLNKSKSIDAYPELVDAVCEDLGYVRRRIVGDGNCLFRCLAERVLGDEDLHGRVRNEIVDAVSRDPSKVRGFLEESFEAYCHRMRLDAVWGGELELRTAAVLYERNIIVYSLMHPPICIESRSGIDDMIPVLYFNQCHYDLLYTVEEMNLMEEVLGDLRGISPTGAARWKKKMEQTEVEDYEFAVRLQRGEVPSAIPKPKSNVDSFLLRHSAVNLLIQNGSIAYDELARLVGAVETEKQQRFFNQDLGCIRPTSSIRSRCDSIDKLLKKRPTIQEMVVSGILCREDVRNSLLVSEQRKTA